MVLLKSSRAISLLCYHFLLLVLIANIVLSADPNHFRYEEATIQDCQNAFQQRRLTSKDLVQYYLDKIEKLNPKLRAILETNPDARHEADKADRERTASPSGSRLGDMHGIPVVVRDTFATRDALNTTCGSYALLGTEPKSDATVIDKLKKAGAIILAKSSMTEWRMRSTKIPTGWNARGGQALNPYVLESKGPCGTSSGTGIAIASNMAMVGMIDTSDRGISCSADYCSVVGIKPTKGLTSRSGCVGLSERTGTVGCHARYVADAVTVMEKMVGYDEKDPEATLKASKYIPEGGYKQFLKKDGLSGKKIGVLKYNFLEPDDDPNDSSNFDKALEVMRNGGATVVDGLKLDNIDLMMDNDKSGAFPLYLTDLKMAINHYFRRKVTRSRVWSLTDVIAFNKQNAHLEKIDEYGQDNLIKADMTNGYGKQEVDTANLLMRMVKQGFEKMMNDNKLDAVVTPGYKFERPLSQGGYPGITVPAWYDKNGVPHGVFFSGLKGTEPKLIECAYAFEQATMARKPPPTSYSN